MQLVVATRRSALALAQTRAFVRDLCAGNPGLSVEELQVVTTGDKVQDRPLSEIGGKGLFVKEIEEALLEGRARFAVHSMKDLPARLPPGLSIACVPERADPRDVLLVPRGREPSLAALPAGARVGSSSMRRKLALLRARPDLAVEPLRGNIDTRLRKLEMSELEGGGYDGILLAAAGLSRLGVPLESLPPHAALSMDQMLPAVAQGILAIEARDGDDETWKALSVKAHAPTALRAAAERGVLVALEADCTVPLAAHAVVEGTRLELRAWLAEPDGSRLREGSSDGTVETVEQAHALGFALGKKLAAG